jgi:hypothetical protein
MSTPEAGKTANQIRLTTVKVQENELPIVIRIGQNFDKIVEKRNKAREIIIEKHFEHLIVPRTNLTNQGFLRKESYLEIGGRGEIMMLQIAKILVLKGIFGQAVLNEKRDADRGLTLIF